jgi:GNAT superfamily N-acetyltransferase
VGGIVGGRLMGKEQHMTQYRILQEEEIDRDLFREFIRRQNVAKCWRKEEGAWVIKDAPFVDDWTEEDYQILVSCLKNTAATGGFVYGAFCGGVLKGFVSVEPGLLGREQEYMDLSSIHISEDVRGQGIGKRLFLAAKDWAREKGAGKLYISAHSAVESQAFYRAMGCVEALEYQQAHVEKEPFDCQLECRL